MCAARAIALARSRATVDLPAPGIPVISQAVRTGSTACSPIAPTSSDLTRLPGRSRRVDDLPDRGHDQLRLVVVDHVTAPLGDHVPPPPAKAAVLGADFAGHAEETVDRYHRA